MHLVDLRNGSGVSPLQQRLANEAEYIEKAYKKKGLDINHIEREEERVKYATEFECEDEFNRLKAESSARDHKRNIVKQEAAQRNSGDWFKKYQTQGDKLEEDVDSQVPTSGGRMLDEFIGQRKAATEQYDEDDDDDIYQQY